MDSSALEALTRYLPTAGHTCWHLPLTPASAFVTAWPVSFPQPATVLRWTYAVGFLAGTYTHARGILAHGFLATLVPTAIGAYWDALTLLDPLAVLLLWRRPRAGL